MLISQEKKNLILEALESYEAILQSSTLCGEDWEYINWSSFSDKIPVEEAPFGVSKGVLIPEEGNYVVKIPFDGEAWEEVEEYDSVAEEYTGNYESIFRRFEFASENLENITREWDYCEVELYFYNLAKENHLEKFFPETELIGYVGGRPIYIQAKGKTWRDTDTSSLVSHEDITNAQRSLKEKGPMTLKLSTDFSALVIKVYGIYDLMKLNKFILQNDINDLHNSNIGLIDNKPIILDFSGYRV